MTAQTERIKENGHPLLLEKEEHGLKGDLTTFYRDTFFKGTVSEHIMTAEDASRLPDVLNTLMGAVLKLYEQEPLFSEARVISSVASEIAWGEMPPLFWKHYAYTRELIQRLKSSPRSLVREFGERFTSRSLAASGIVDTDVLLMEPQNLSFQDVGLRIANQFNVPSNNIQKVGSTEQVKFVFPLQNYIIHVISGHSLVADIDIMKMSIRNSTNPDQEITHIDWTKAGDPADKRYGMTMSWQDGVYARLDLKDDRVEYAMDPEVVATMRKQNSYDSKLNETGGIVEIFARGLRRSLFHIQYDQEAKKDFIYKSNGQRLNLPQLDRFFFPLFTSGSIFELRNRLDTLQINGNLRLPYENPDLMFLLESEVALVLRIDPEHVAQAGRDTGIAAAIPGLRELSYRDWNRILHSLSMAGDLAGVTTYSRDPSEDYMIQQRNIYLGRDPKYPSPQFDGVERFMRAVLKIPKGSFDDLWEAYLQLWHEPNTTTMHPVIINRGSIGQNQRGQEMSLNGVPVIIYRIDGEPLYGRQLLKGLKQTEVLNEAEFRLVWSARKDEALQEINGNSHNPWVSQAQNPDIENPLVGKRHEQTKKLHSIGYVAAILRTFATGRTPRELEKIYAIVTKGEQVLPFNEAFWELKLTGFVARHEMWRIDRYGKEVPVSIYSWQKPSVRTSLSEASVRENLFPYYVNIMKHDFPYINLLRPVIYRRMMDRFRKYHVHSVEVAMSLNVKEDREFVPEGEKNLFTEDIKILQTAVDQEAAQEDIQ